MTKKIDFKILVNEETYQKLLKIIERLSIP